MKKLKMCGIIFLILSLTLVCGSNTVEAANTMADYISTPPLSERGRGDPQLASFN